MTDKINLSADVRFGQAMHHTTKQYVMMENEDIFDVFCHKWLKYRDWNLTYNESEDWNFFNALGASLLHSFLKSYEEQNLIPVLGENTLYISDGFLKKSLRPDFVATRDNKIIIIDFKVGSQWTQEMADTNEQMTEYAIAVKETMLEEPPIIVAICNMVKKTQIVCWLYSLRTEEQIEQYREKLHNLHLTEVMGGNICFK